MGRALARLEAAVEHLAEAASRSLRAGAPSLDVAVTHALFVDDAPGVLARSGVRSVWSTDCVPHPSNVVSVVPMLAETIGLAAAGVA